MLYDVRFEPLFHEGRALSFPCDCQGHVDIDGLSVQTKRDYLFARAMIGREYSTPVVREHCELRNLAA